MFYIPCNRPSLELACGNCESSITKTRGACALTRAGGSPYTIKLRSACRKPYLSLSGSDPVPLSKVGTHLLASMGSKGKNRNSLACLRNADSHSAVTYCVQLSTIWRDAEIENCSPWDYVEGAAVGIISGVRNNEDMKTGHGQDDSHADVRGHRIRQSTSRHSDHRQSRQNRLYIGVRKNNRSKKPSRKGRGDSISTAPHAAKSNSLVPRAKGQPEEPLNYDFALSSGAGT